MSTANSTNPSRGQSAGAGLGNTVKGAFQTVQGLGNSIRGNAMDFVDAATGTGGRHTETDIGRHQTEQGINQMETGKHAPTSTQASATSTAAPPLPARNHQGAGVQTDSATLGEQNLGQPR
ncbi:hypothetical protein C8Q77DRAFT_1217284 [Trametes polyzona]|nr:hypothetical protein C8Q77DRAFT_1217284 [Trametes polyzona]